MLRKIIVLLAIIALVVTNTIATQNLEIKLSEDIPYVWRSLKA